MQLSQKFKAMVRPIIGPNEAYFEGSDIGVSCWFDKDVFDNYTVMDIKERTKKMTVNLVLICLYVVTFIN